MDKTSGTGLQTTANSLEDPAVASIGQVNLVGPQEIPVDYQPLVPPVGIAGPTKFWVVYFFAGAVRKFDIRFWFEQLCVQHNYQLCMEEIDLLRPGSNNDLGILTLQEQWTANLGKYNAVLITPPCSSFSRVTWANSRGPPPVRSANFPRGFPWLSKLHQDKAELGNTLTDFTWTILEKVQELGLTTNITGFAEHPEDLGRVRGRGPADVPASIWQASRFANLVKKGWWSGAFRQDKFGAPTAKPTRAIAKGKFFSAVAPSSMPTFDTRDFTLGQWKVAMGFGHLS